MRKRYVPSDAAKQASLHYNALPIAERGKLAPLLEHYRQMGIAETLDRIDSAVAASDRRIGEIAGSDIP